MKKRNTERHPERRVTAICACLCRIVPAMQPSRCARCRFGQRCPAVHPTYACVLVCGPDTADAWQKHADWARNNPVLGVTAYCQQCAQITWLSDDEDANSALVHNVTSSRRMIVATAGMQALCGVRPAGC